MTNAEKQRIRSYNELNKERKMRIQGSLAYVFAGCPCLFG